MKLHLIYRKHTNRKTLIKFHEAAQELNVEIVEIVSNNFNFSHPEKITQEDAVYCMSDDSLSQLVEKSLIGLKTKTFYKDYITAIAKLDDADDVTSYLVHQINGLPVIPSVPTMTKDKKLLREYAEKLGGFPIVIKALGRSKGYGTMRIDSIESLNSIGDYLLGTGDRFIVKKYIQEAKSIRVVVLGGKAIAAIKHRPIEGDFRSNTGQGDHRVESYALNEAEAQIAIAAVMTLGLEFGGVDLSIDAQERIFITEVNMPCAFVVTERVTKKNIAKELIHHLQNK